MAIAYGQTKIVRTLLEAGANPNLVIEAMKNWPNSPLKEAYVVKHLYTNSLDGRVYRPRINCLKLLLEYGANPNQLLNGWSIGRLASSGPTRPENKEFLELLIKYGADPSLCRR